MGTTVWHKAKGVKALAEIKAHLGPEFMAKVVASTATFAAVFMAARIDKPSDWLLRVYEPEADGSVIALEVFKLSVRRGEYYNFGYKDMSETSGPYGLEAPLSILAKCSKLKPVVEGSPDALKWATEYRARCSKAAAAKAFKRRLKPGVKVTLAAPVTFRNGKSLGEFTVDRARVRGNKGASTVFRGPDCGLYRLTARNLEGATLSTED